MDINKMLLTEEEENSELIKYEHSIKKLHLEQYENDLRYKEWMSLAQIKKVIDILSKPYREHPTHYDHRYECRICKEEIGIV